MGLDISITSHGAALTSLLAVLHHTPMKLTTGEMLPVVIKATKQDRSENSLSYTTERADELKENIEAVQKEIDQVWEQQEQSSSAKKVNIYKRLS